MKYLQEFLNPNSSRPQTPAPESEAPVNNLQNLQKSVARTQNRAFVGSVGSKREEGVASEESSSLPPALQEYPGIDLVEPGLWVWRGFIVPTPATMPAYRKHYQRQIKLRREREQSLERDEPL